MTKIVLIIFSILTLLSGYMTYSGIGLQEVKSIEPPKPSVRSYSTGSSWSSSGSSGGFSYGK